MSSAALENMLIWTRNLEHSYIRLRQNYTDLPKTAPQHCPKRKPRWTHSCVMRKLLVTYARGLCGCAGEVNTPLNRYRDEHAWRLQAIRFTYLRQEVTDRERRKEVTPPPVYSLDVSVCTQQSSLHPATPNGHSVLSYLQCNCWIARNDSQVTPGGWIGTSLNFSAGTLQRSKASSSR